MGEIVRIVKSFGKGSNWWIWKMKTISIICPQYEAKIRKSGGGGLFLGWIIFGDRLDKIAILIKNQ